MISVDKVNPSQKNFTRTLDVSTCLELFKEQLYDNNLKLMM